MQNIRSAVEGNELVIRVDLSQNLGPSSSGKTDLVANSKGFASVDAAPGVIFSLNVCRKKK